MMRFLVHAPLILAIVLVIIAARADDPALRASLAAGVALLLGASAALSGVRAVRRGSVLLRTRHATRVDQPVAFWTAVILFRFGLAAVLLAGGIAALLGRL